MTQLIRPLTRPLCARVPIPGSKSMTNRAFLLAALAEGSSSIADILLSDDTRAFVDALQQLGVVIRIDERALTCQIQGCGGRFPNRAASIWCAEAGTAARFLLAVCAATPGTFQFDGAPSLQKRPLATLIHLLRQQGAQFIPSDATALPFTVSTLASLTGGALAVESGETGQYLSALLMAAPLFKEPVFLTAEDPVSRPYIEMTCNMMADFGVQVDRLPENIYSVSAPQRYQAQHYRIEPDLSTASYFFAAAAITKGEVTIQPIDRQLTKQGDVAFLKVLESMGCQVQANAEGLTVQGSTELSGIQVDMRDFSDTFMTLAAIAPFANSPTTITNIQHTRKQESDRMKAVCEGLMALNIKVEEGPDWLRIYPGMPSAGKIQSHHDHRIAMAFSIIGLRVAGIEIEDAECVSKTCPRFFEMLEEMSDAK